MHSFPEAVSQLSWKHILPRKPGVMSKARDSLPDAEETVNEPSTAPTTPDGSQTFSPVLQPTHLLDAFELSSSPQNDTLTSDRIVRNICCIGAGYVGGPSAAMIAYYNPSIRVTVVDRDADRIQRWKSKHLPIYEPGLLDIVRAARDGCKKMPFGDADIDNINKPRQPNLFFSTETMATIAGADIIFVAVNTPTKMKGAGAACATNMAALEGAVRDIAIHAKPGAIIVEKSTVPCRTSELIYEILETHRPGVLFHVISNPEFLAEGTAIQDLLRPSRVLIGSKTAPVDLQAANALANVYAAWVPRSRIVTINVWSSELAKLVANSMLAQRISSINSISAICEKTGADIDEVAKSIGLDPRIGPKYLKAGIGFGGSCFQKDILSLVYLADSLGLNKVGDYWRQVVTMNDWQCNRFSNNVINSLNNTLMGKKVTVLGYAFKKNTGDTRDSLAPAIIKALVEEGPREIAIFDPLCKPDAMTREIKSVSRDCTEQLFKPDGPISIVNDPYEACLNTNAVLILNDCDEFLYTPCLTSPSFETRPRSKVSQTLLPALDRETTVMANSELAGQEDEYLHEPTACTASCPDCCLEAEADQTKAVFEGSLDWRRVSENMQKPRLVFDGRGVLQHVNQMETTLGLRVVCIGKS